MSNRNTTRGEVDKDALLAEYQANVSLWQHDDDLRQQRNGNFLTVNTILLAAAGALTAFEVPLGYLGAIGIFFSAFGIIVCRVWYAVQARNAEWIMFRRLQLLSVESHLAGQTTFRNTYEAFYRVTQVHFPAIGETFAVKPGAANRSTLWEGRLPILVAGFWALVGVTGLVLVLVSV